MRRVWLALALLNLPTTLRAQTQASGDLGVAHLRQTGLPESNAVTAGALLDAIGDHSFLRSSGLVALAPGSRITGQALLTASLFYAPANAARWEASGTASAFGQTGGPPAASIELLGRRHLIVGNSGLAIGAGGGVVNDAGAHPLVQARADAWTIMGGQRLLLSTSFTSTSASNPSAAPRPLAAAERVSYADAAASWLLQTTGYSLDATAGARSSSGGASGVSGWGSVNAIVGLAPQLALVASAGRTLADLVRGIPPTEYASIALRVYARPGRDLAQPSVRPVRGPVALVDADGLVVRAPSASRVEIKADFTDWMPVALEPRDGDWRLRRSLASGLHRIVIRIDGGDWIAPANLPRATDDLGGVVGLIGIP